MAEEDINYQPKVNEQSFSGKGAHGERKIVVSLTTEIIGLLIIFVLFLFVLNYFKVISFSSLFRPILNNPSNNTQNTTNAALISSNKTTKGPEKKIVVGLFKGATSDSITLIRLEKGVNLANFKLDRASVFNQIDDNNKILKTYSTLDLFEQAVASDKDKLIKIYYLQTNLENLAITVSLFKSP